MVVQFKNTICHMLFFNNHFSLFLSAAREATISNKSNKHFFLFSISSTDRICILFTLLSQLFQFRYIEIISQSPSSMRHIQSNPREYCSRIIRNCMTKAVTLYPHECKRMDAFYGFFCETIEKDWVPRHQESLICK